MAEKNVEREAIVRLKLLHVGIEFTTISTDNKQCNAAPLILEIADAKSMFIVFLSLYKRMQRTALPSSYPVWVLKRVTIRATFSNPYWFTPQ